MHPIPFQKNFSMNKALFQTSLVNPAEAVLVSYTVKTFWDKSSTMVTLTWSCLGFFSWVLNTVNPDMIWYWPFKLSFHIDNPEIILYCPFELSFQIDKLDMILYWLIELSFHIDNPDMILYWPFRLSLPYCLSIHNHLVTLRASSSILMVLTWSCTNI